MDSTKSAKPTASTITVAAGHNWTPRSLLAITPAQWRDAPVYIVVSDATQISKAGRARRLAFVQNQNGDRGVLLYASELTV